MGELAPSTLSTAAWPEPELSEKSPERPINPPFCENVRPEIKILPQGRKVSDSSFKPFGNC